MCDPEKLEKLRDIASPGQQKQIAEWTKQWEGGEAVISPNWFPEDQLHFTFLQYVNLDEGQFRAKLSQMHGGMKLYFKVWQPGHISPAVTLEKQEAEFEALRSYAAQFGINIEEKSDP